MSGTQPAGSAYQTELDEKARHAEEAAAKPTGPTASAIELGTFEAGHDESDLQPPPPDSGLVPPEVAQAPVDVPVADVIEKGEAQ